MYVKSTAMVTPLGNDMAAVSCAIKSNLCCVEESSFVNKSGQALKMAFVPEEAMPLAVQDVNSQYPSLTARQSYLLRLCHAALSDTFIASFPEQPIPVLLAGPDDQFSSVSPGLTAGFLKALSEARGIPLLLEQSRVFPHGRAAIFHAVDCAFRLMAESETEHVIVGGVDCHRDFMLLSKLDAEDRVLYTGNAIGFAPSEGAAFLLLSKKPVCYAEGDKLIRLNRPGLGEEKGAICSEAAYLGEGLDQSVKKSLPFADDRQIKSIYSSMNGEPYWAKELGVMMIRNKAAFRPDVNVEHPADCLGDLGAAFAGVVMAYLANEGAGTYLVYGSSDSAFRAASCVDIFDRGEHDRNR